VLNKQSGLMGISGLTNDMRELLDEARESGDRRASLAVEIFCYRVRKYVGAYLAAMNGADALIFTGGIGENSAEVRARICEGLDWMGVELDPALNESHKDRREGLISHAEARLSVYVIPTDEELLIARDTVRLIRGVKQRF
jgi:acetate kinase